jgi:pimeloyl-ACP methyl ester carboxylesterase
MADGDVAEEVATADRRALTYLDVGDPNGPLVIHNHGGPSRLEARLPAVFASKNRLRLICGDRPGMGQSSPQRVRSYSDWADDLVTLADALGYLDPLRLRAVWHPVEGAGHFVAVGAGDDVFAIAAEELDAA